MQCDPGESGRNRKRKKFLKTSYQYSGTKFKPHKFKNMASLHPFTLTVWQHKSWKSARSEDTPCRIQVHEMLKRNSLYAISSRTVAPKWPPLESQEIDLVRISEILPKNKMFVITTDLWPIVTVTESNGDNGNLLSGSATTRLPNFWQIIEYCIYWTKGCRRTWKEDFYCHLLSTISRSVTYPSRSIRWIDFSEISNQIVSNGGQDPWSMTMTFTIFTGGSLSRQIRGP